MGSGLLLGRCTGPPLTACVRAAPAGRGQEGWRGGRACPAGERLADGAEAVGDGWRRLDGGDRPPTLRRYVPWGGGAWSARLWRRAPPSLPRTEPSGPPRPGQAPSCLRRTGPRSRPSLAPAPPPRQASSAQDRAGAGHGSGRGASRTPPGGRGLTPPTPPQRRAEPRSARLRPPSAGRDGAHPRPNLHGRRAGPPPPHPRRADAGTGRAHHPHIFNAGPSPRPHPPQRPSRAAPLAPLAPPNARKGGLPLAQAAPTRGPAAHPTRASSTPRRLPALTARTRRARTARPSPARSPERQEGRRPPHPRNADAGASRAPQPLQRPAVSPLAPPTNGEPGLRAPRPRAL